MDAPSRPSPPGQGLLRFHVANAEALAFRSDFSRDLYELSLRLSLEKSDNTRRAYLAENLRFLRALDKSPKEINERDVRDYIVELALNRANSFSRIAQAYSALRYFYERIRKQDFFRELPAPRKDEDRPTPLTPAHAERVIRAGRDPRSRAMLRLIYNAGLRSRELIELRRSDFDVEEGALLIDAGGSNERRVKLSPALFFVLEEYLTAAQENGLIFPGRGADGKLGKRTVERAFQAALKNANLPEKTDIRALRAAGAEKRLLEKKTAEEMEKARRKTGFNALRSKPRRPAPPPDDPGES